jgi:hypothetical protein
MDKALIETFGEVRKYCSTLPNEGQDATPPPPPPPDGGGGGGGK